MGKKEAQSQQYLVQLQEYRIKLLPLSLNVILLSVQGSKLQHLFLSGRATVSAGRSIGRTTTSVVVVGTSIGVGVVVRAVTERKALDGFWFP